MMNMFVVLRTWVKTLQLSVLAAYNAAFPVGIVDNLFTAKEQGFLPGSKDDDINDLIKSFELATNVVLAKVDVDEILHTCC